MTDPLFLFDPTCDDTPVNTDELHTGWRLTLPQHVRKHALQAMRLGEGDQLQLSDGAGLRIQAVLRDAQSGLVEVTTVGKEAEPTTKLALVQALAKGGHDEQAVDMATQIGVDAVIPWQADRSIVKWKASKMERKWSNLLGSATEQSRRAWKPELNQCLSSRQLAQYCSQQSEAGSLVIVLHQDATQSWAQTRDSVRALSTQSGAHTISVIVGPEGGISEQEAQSFVSAGAIATTLGNNILRASSAGPVALSVLSDLISRFDA
ncbi:ribosomal RNA small subunit methyltransferase E [Bombiscardovia apis]|uniref:Ribosomal RNA small subunit methyltransferase E n=1 Tax=Bombiscardovia apis TaxID=2932182 RepID=A0ABM8BCJ1_9BIFI|nr:16S rRNA (uracil(1498)-N(3))-methyltransferase [Bombiscardovia apis]BDR54599.1 ribosomal RNA small subunit methyltransferase E [Bombiscardovia apis]